MLCCTSVLSSVLRSMAQGLGELLYAVLQICALVLSWALVVVFNVIRFLSFFKKEKKYNSYATLRLLRLVLKA